MRPDGKVEGIRQSMSWLHTWTGILLGSLLYAVFFTGTLSYFLDEINLWMKPELHISVPNQDTAQTALHAMESLAPGAAVWTLGLPHERQTTVEASWREPGKQAAGRAGLKRAELDAATGDVLTPRETRGGSFLYRFHFELHAMPRNTARWIVGIATMFMFVAIISGVITHKKIFADFFTFRPKKGQRSWLDAHNATAVLALPFHIMITFSGLLLLMYLLMPWGLDAVYQGDRQAFAAERRATGAGGGGGGGGATQGGESRRERVKEAAPMELPEITPMLRFASAQWDGKQVGTITVNRPMQSGSTIELRELGSDSLSTRGASRRIVFDAKDGTVKSIPPIAEPSTTSAIYNVLSATHMGRFAGPMTRWFLFLSGVLGTVMVGTGLALWVVKRLPERKKLGRTPFGHILVEKTNIAVIAGLGLATASYFWLNRLLPAEMTGRMNWEINGFFLVWLASLLYAVVRPTRKAWIEQCVLVTLMFALLPVLNSLTGGSGLVKSVSNGQWAIAGFDIAMLIIASIFAAIAYRLNQKQNAERKLQKPVEKLGQASSEEMAMEAAKL